MIWAWISMGACISQFVAYRLLGRSLDRRHARNQAQCEEMNRLIRQLRRQKALTDLARSQPLTLNNNYSNN